MALGELREGAGLCLGHLSLPNENLRVRALAKLPQVLELGLRRGGRKETSARRLSSRASRAARHSSGCVPPAEAAAEARG